jgi:hypothetical protein
MGEWTRETEKVPRWPPEHSRPDHTDAHVLREGRSPPGGGGSNNSRGVFVACWVICLRMCGLAVAPVAEKLLHQQRSGAGREAAATILPLDESCRSHSSG